MVPNHGFRVSYSTPPRIRSQIAMSEVGAQGGLRIAHGTPRAGENGKTPARGLRGLPTRVSWPSSATR